MNRRAFTLIELLVAIAIISLLAAIILPVFASVRAKGRQTVCTSNLRQLGIGFALYGQDADDLLPLGGDPIDINTNGWQTANGGIYWAEAQKLHPLAEVLAPYVASRELWRCPSDTGFDTADFYNRPFAAHPSAFEQYEESYDYRTELALRQVTLTGMTAYDAFPPFAEHGASEINLLCDLSGSWHGGIFLQDKRFNVLMGDGHVKTLPLSAVNAAWALWLDKPAH